MRLTTIVNETKTGSVLVMTSGEVDQWPASAMSPFQWPVLVIDRIGTGLRQVAVLRPRVVIMLVPSGESLPIAEAMIAALHRRRPEVMVIAVCGEQSDGIERRVRAAGANAYIVAEYSDTSELETLLGSVHVGTADVGPASLCPLRLFAAAGDTVCSGAYSSAAAAWQ